MNKYVKANGILSLFSKNYMELKKDLPIRPSEMGVLNIITQTDGKYTPVDLARMLNVSKPMITTHINVLEKKGYITKELSTVDKRAYYIIPTDKAEELAQKTNIVLNQQLKKIEDSMGKEKFENFVHLADEVNEIIRRED